MKPRTTRTPRTRAILRTERPRFAQICALFVTFVKFVVEIARWPERPRAAGVDLTVQLGPIASARPPSHPATTAALLENLKNRCLATVLVHLPCRFRLSR